ncbi:MAG TPA: lipoyl synthase, partial [Polyangia bacterium]|nr:lipoyl synthase [Polyangia bacterium]
MSERATPAPPTRPGRKPPWIRVRIAETPGVQETRRRIRGHKLGTVCEEAACPNLSECWARGHATVMVLGTVCTRACAFCNVAT